MKGQHVKVKVKSLSCVQLFTTPWTGACQAPLCMGFPSQEYWNGLPFPSPGGLPHPGMEPRSPTLQADSLPSEPPGKPSWVKVGQTCPTLCDSIDYTVHGILQARILEWVVVPFSRGSSQPRDRTQVFLIAGRFFYQLNH